MLNRSTGAVLALILGGCSRPEAVTGGGPGEFHASVTGAVAAEYRGSGGFHFGGGDSPYMGIELRAGPGATDDRISLAAPGRSSPPGVGTYRVASSAGDPHPAASAPVFEVVFTRDAAGIHETYAADRGEVVFQVSSPGQVKGTFWFEAAKVCARPVVGNPARGCSPDWIDPGSPRIRVRGSFEAVRDRPEEWMPA
jgi:hypothetical protein